MEFICLLFKIVVEVACDALVQVYHVVSHHVVAAEMCIRDRG